MRMRVSLGVVVLGLAVSGCAGLGAFIVNSLTALQGAPAVKKRISGKSFFELAKKDSKDTFFEPPGQPGFLCVVHNPGCGIVGNDGHDKFFVPGKQLPLLTQVVGVQFTAIAPHGWPATNPGGLGGQGSYGATIVNNGKILDGSDPIEVAWNNTCADRYDAVDVWYRVSFIVSTKEGVDLQDIAVDPTSSADAPACAPPEFIAALPPDTGNPLPIQPTGWEGTLRACNPFNTPITRSFHIEASLQSANPGATGKTTMDDTSTVTFPAVGFGSAPAQATFKTQQIYTPGTWKVTKVEIIGLADAVSGPLPTTALPGVVGSPPFDFSGGSCVIN